MEENRILKGFSIVEKEGRMGNIYYQLQVETQKGKKTEIFMTESQKEYVDEIGKDNCYVDIENRESKEKKIYQVVALHAGDEIFDFFVKDKAFVSLAKLHAGRK